MDGRSISHEVLESFRFSAIELHRREVPIEDIADSFGVTRQAVYRWIKLEKIEGKARKMFFYLASFFLNFKHFVKEIKRTR